MTNNSQQVYLDPPSYLGDDETTIVFTQNVTRIVENPIIQNEEIENENIESHEATEYEELSLRLSPTFFQIIKTMMNLPDDHFAWSYSNPT